MKHSESVQSDCVSRSYTARKDTIRAGRTTFEKNGIEKNGIEKNGIRRLGTLTIEMSRCILAWWLSKLMHSQGSKPSIVAVSFRVCEREADVKSVDPEKVARQDQVTA